jgi:hypothetical protein
MAVQWPLNCCSTLMGTWVILHARNVRNARNWNQWWTAINLTGDWDAPHGLGPFIIPKPGSMTCTTRPQRTYMRTFVGKTSSSSEPKDVECLRKQCLSWKVSYSAAIPIPCTPYPTAARCS